MRTVRGTLLSDIIIVIIATIIIIIMLSISIIPIIAITLTMTIIIIISIIILVLLLLLRLFNYLFIHSFIYRAAARASGSPRAGTCLSPCASSRTWSPGTKRPGAQTARQTATAPVGLGWLE